MHLARQYGIQYQIDGRKEQEDQIWERTEKVRKQSIWIGRNRENACARKATTAISQRRLRKRYVARIEAWIRRN